MQCRHGLTHLMREVNKYCYVYSWLLQVHSQISGFDGRVDYSLKIIVVKVQ